MSTVTHWLLTIQSTDVIFQTEILHAKCKDICGHLYFSCPTSLFIPGQLLNLGKMPSQNGLGTWATFVLHVNSHHNHFMIYATTPNIKKKAVTYFDNFMSYSLGVIEQHSM